MGSLAEYNHRHALQPQFNENTPCARKCCWSPFGCGQNFRCDCHRVNETKGQN